MKKITLRSGDCDAKDSYTTIKNYALQLKYNYILVY